MSKWRVGAGLVLGLMVAFTTAGFEAAAPATAPAGAKVTFTKDVAPILYGRCVECHRPTMFAPMSLITYEETRPWARAIRQRVSAREMPPWFADPRYGEFENDDRLSQREIETIVAWVDAGAPKGDLKDLPPRPQFADGWAIGTPDVVFTMLEVVAHFDNSRSNPFNPDPTQPVRWGDQTWEEMMIGWYTTIRDVPQVTTTSDNR